MIDIIEHIKDRHLKRRMFAIINDKLIIAEPNIPDSHIDWFIKDRIINNESDTFFNEIIRGVIKENGCIWFYFGKEFLVDEKAEKIFFSHLVELVKILNINQSAMVKGGKIRGNVLSGDWPARKIYGSVKECKKFLNIIPQNKHNNPVR